ncbi:histidine kinase [Kribbella flavida DSM 17836]|uniref:histidine kinase n=1 Tax=Kribbella flavida (strain DSM 17836 / JCM 10339 / NBRC 14399) TaxID=479435 RepID=D2PUU9_KRIFD|nr:histidine kinase [Kribbella flavida]ADB31415.1 histidine kinase [Kribbella flavida DSM 17836]
MGGFAEVRALAERNRSLRDVAAAVAVGAVCAAIQASRAQFSDRSPDLASWGWLVLMTVPLVWRRRAPAVVFWLVFGLAWGAELVGVDTAATVVMPMVAIYTVARHGTRRRLVPALVAVEATVLTVTLVEQAAWGSAVGVTAIVAVVILFALNLRTREAYLAQLEERAARLARDRDQQARLAVSAERTRIAREVHDIVAHNVAVMIALADGAAYTATRSPERAADTMTKVSATGRQALGEMRRLLGLLREGETAGAEDELVARPSDVLRSGDVLSPQPGVDDIDLLLDQVRTAGLRVSLIREGDLGRWGPGAGLAVYRIVQEALTNTLKHAGRRARAEVRIRCTEEDLELMITDDGAGRQARTDAADERSGGHGLAGIAERAASYGGELEAGPTAVGGWCVWARLRTDDRVAG